MTVPNEIICGDCIAEMQKMPGNSFDGIVTDPPYGLGFMGKDWDTFKPDVVVQQMKRDTRTQKRRELYGGRESDAPSAAMAAGRYDFSRNAEFQQWFTVWATEALRIVKPGTFMLIFGGTRTYHRLACAIEDAGWQIRDCISWLYGSGFPKSSNISLQFDRRACLEQLTEKLGRKPTKEELKKEWEDFRKVVGDNPNCRPNCAGQQTRAMAAPITVQPITAPITGLAKLWDGYGTALKPAWEPIIVAMKPLEGTFAQNAEKYGVAGLNIDGGRIGTEENLDRISGDFTGTGFGMKKGNVTSTHPQGRWPANVVLDEEAAAILDEQSGELQSGDTPKRRNAAVFKTCYGEFQGSSSCPDGRAANSGGASRFFYCAKASRAERNAGLKGMEEKQIDLSRDPENPGGNNPRNRGARKDVNFHPTVKPLKLMEYLCRLLKPPSEHPILLDPFTGSGTTLMAAVNTGWDYVGIEKESDYVKIARRRVAWMAEQAIGQLGLWK